jgi:hypothetical protein
MADELERSESMFSITAKLFAAIAKEVTEEFGQAGEQAIRRAVRAFGIERGRKIARNAAADGKPNTVENYLPYYDMERSDLFEYDTVYSGGEVPDRIDQYFHKCPLSRAWIDTGTTALGKLYCEEVDVAIAYGFNPDLKYQGYANVMDGSPCCHMSFTLRNRPDQAD